MRSLCVEGWRFLHHSYAVVNQWQLLSLMKRDDVALTVCDVPFCNLNWTPLKGLLPPDFERKLDSIPILNPDQSADVTLRISYPFDFTLRPGGRTAVFATTE